MVIMVNDHKVPKKQWKKWDDLEKYVFNALYELMGDQQFYKHYDAGFMHADHWKVVRWNAAWSAAELLREQRKGV